MSMFLIETEAAHFNTGPKVMRHEVVADEQWKAVERACGDHRALVTPWGTPSIRLVRVVEV